MSIRPACSLILTRQSGEVYLARRAEALRFFGGFWAFPGGGVHAADRDRAGLAPAASGADAPWILAAAREGLEELGLALFDATGLDLGAARQAVLDDPASFARLLEERERTVDATRLTPVLRLLTPPFLPIRFDTIFYAVQPTTDDRLEIWPGELVDGGWDTPGRWLERWRRGELLIAPPVVLALQILEAHGIQGARPAFAALEESFVAGSIHPIHFNPAVRLLPLLTPTLPPATHTNAYAIGHDPAYLIDPATPHPEEQAHLIRALDEMVEEGRRFAAVILTHHHPDHVGAATRAAQHLEVPVWAHPITRALLAESVATHGDVVDGQVLPLGSSPDGRDGWEMRAVFTPGHAAGHLCFFEDRYGSLLAGDMVSTLSSILVHPDDGDMAIYLESLERLGRLEVRMVFPAHGPATGKGREALTHQLAHRAQREAAVLASLADGPAAVDSIVTAVYTDLDPRMRPYAALSVQSLLKKLVDEERVTWRDDRAMLR